MGGNEIFGNEEIQECMEVLQTGILMRYNFDKERKGIFKVRTFEEEFARFHGVKHALGVTSGSTALKIALTAMDICPGDEIIVPAFTFIATYEAVIEAGAIPVMADIDESLNLDPKDIVTKMTPYTKAVIPVHMCGAGANIEQIVATAKNLQLLVLEDNAQALGGSYKGQKLGSFGAMATFSFDYYKTITTGEGGMVITNSKNLYERADWYHDHGHDHDHTVSRAMEGRTILGFNYRMNELQGALGLAQLRKLEYIIGEQRKNKARVKEMLASVKGIGFRKHFDESGDTATFLAFNFEGAAKAMAFQKALGENGVDVVCFKNNKWHYCPNWEHLLAWSTANSRKFPFASNDYRGKVEYSIRNIPQAEDLLGRTLVMGIPVKMSAERLQQIEKAIDRAKSVV
ncbi:MAG: DegT/DnrJ/EryC1/StrS family aminotransferase [Deltaproteobacteria bacterium]|nr:DegT/DnrJ/EryC1/StrS family aminotransferase [Deltaproteobacteria bacterium]